jgi:Zn-dependent protease with chaperone function
MLITHLAIALTAAAALTVIALGRFKRRHSTRTVRGAAMEEAMRDQASVGALSGIVWLIYLFLLVAMLAQLYVSR